MRDSVSWRVDIFWNRFISYQTIQSIHFTVLGYHYSNCLVILNLCPLPTLTPSIVQNPVHFVANTSGSGHHLKLRPAIKALMAVCRLALAETDILIFPP